ncbi:MAG: hypothetical protein V4615_03435 [Bacteroidota bacterium]
MPRKKKLRFHKRVVTTRSRFSKPVDMPDVGAYVKEELYGLKISIPAVAKRMNVSADRAYRLMRRKDWKVSEIMNLSTIIGLNIFDWYADETQGLEEPETLSAASPETDLAQLRQRNAVLEAENKLLREMMGVIKGPNA